MVAGSNAPKSMPLRVRALERGVVREFRRSLGAGYGDGVGPGGRSRSSAVTSMVTDVAAPRPAGLSPSLVNRIAVQLDCVGRASVVHRRASQWFPLRHWRRSAVYLSVFAGSNVPKLTSLRARLLSVASSESSGGASAQVTVTV